jgi:hypothetical protein
VGKHHRHPGNHPRKFDDQGACLTTLSDNYDTPKTDKGRLHVASNNIQSKELQLATVAQGATHMNSSTSTRRQSHLQQEARSVRSSMLPPTSCGSQSATALKIHYHGSVVASNSSEPPVHPRPKRYGWLRSTCRVPHNNGTTAQNETKAP